MIHLWVRREPRWTKAGISFDKPWLTANRSILLGPIRLIGIECGRASCDNYRSSDFCESLCPRKIYVLRRSMHLSKSWSARCWWEDWVQGSRKGTWVAPLSSGHHALPKTDRTLIPSESALKQPVSNFTELRHPLKRTFPHSSRQRIQTNALRRLSFHYEASVARNDRRKPGLHSHPIYVAPPLRRKAMASVCLQSVEIAIYVRVAGRQVVVCGPLNTFVYTSRIRTECIVLKEFMSEEKC
jgi:hypothetical protein